MKQWGIKKISSRVSLLALSGVLAIGLAACGGGGGGDDDDAAAVETTGTVVDDYVVDATVWCDANGDGVKDDDETSTVSGASVGELGAYVLAIDCSAQGDTARIGVEGQSTDATETQEAIVTQNVDSDGNVLSDFTGQMFAPPGYEIVSPISTVVEFLRVEAVEEGLDATAALASAEDDTIEVFGLDEGTEVGTVDITSEEASTEGTTANKMKKAVLVAQQIMLDGTNAVQGAVGESVTPASFRAVAEEFAAFVKEQATALEGAADDDAKDKLRIIDSGGTVQEDVVGESVDDVITNTVTNNETTYGTIKDRVDLLVETVTDTTKDNATRVADASTLTGDDFQQEIVNVQSGSTKGINTMISFVRDYFDSSKTAVNTAEELTALEAVFSNAKDDMQTMAQQTFQAPEKGTRSDAVLEDSFTSGLESFINNLNSDANFKELSADNTLDTTKIEGAIISTAGVGSSTNSAPIIGVDSNFVVRVEAGETKAFLLNAIDPDRDSLTFTTPELTSETAPQVALTAGTDDTVTHDYVFDASDEAEGGEFVYSYTVNDGTVDVSGELTIQVVATVDNFAPSANSDSFTIDKSGSVTGQLDGFDIDKDELTFTLGTAPEHHDGDFTINSDGSFTYTNDGTTGTDSFTFTVTDADGSNTASDEATVTINVKEEAGTNNLPQVEDMDLGINPGESITRTVDATDFDNDTLTYAIVDEGVDCDTDPTVCTLTTSKGATVTLTTSTGSYIYTPADDIWMGSDEFTVSASDAEGSASAKVSIGVGGLYFKVLASTVELEDFDGSTKDPDPALSAASVSDDAVLTAIMTDPISATNLTGIPNGTGTPPVMNFELHTNSSGKIPSGQGTATITMMLKDGDSEERDADPLERQITVTYWTAWTSDRETLTLTTIANPDGDSDEITADVIYYREKETAASIATLSDDEIDTLKITSSGAGATPSLEAKIQNLFNAELGDADGTLAGTASEGTYFYKVEISGLPLGICFDGGSGSCSNNAKRKVSTIEGTFVAE